MAAFVHEQEQNETNAELPAPHSGVDPNHKQHGAAGFQEDRQKLEQRQKEKFQLRKKLRDECGSDSHGTERFPHAAPASLSARPCKLRAFGSKIHRLLKLRTCATR